MHIRIQYRNEKMIKEIIQKRYKMMWIGQERYNVYIHQNY